MCLARFRMYVVSDLEYVIMFLGRLKNKTPSASSVSRLSHGHDITTADERSTNRQRAL